MTFDDIYNGVNDVYAITPRVKTYEDAMNALDEIKYNKDLSEAEKTRRALEYVGKDTDLRDIFKENEDVMKELRTQIRNEYNDEDIIKALYPDAKGEKPDLYSYENGWMSIPTKEFILMARNAGLEPKELIRYLGDKQRVRDREMIVEGYDPATGERNMKDWLQSAFMGLTMPRQKEAYKRGEDPSFKDAALDIGEMALYSIPVGGVSSKVVAKVLGKGAKNIRQGIGHWTTQRIKDVADASVVPLATEVADAIAYDDPTNSRSTFNPYDVAIGGLTNAAAPWMIRMGLGTFARPVGSRSGLSKFVENLTADSDTRALYNLEKAFNILRDAKNRASKYTNEELQAARDIIVSSEMVKDNPDLAKYAQYLMGEDLFKSWPNSTVRTKSKEVGNKYNAYLESNPKSVKPKREAQAKNVESNVLPSESEAFEAAGSNVYATDFLKDQNKWGLTKGGRAGLVNKEKGNALDLNTENKIDPRHAVTTAKESRFKASREHGTDRGYPRASDFDKEVDRLIRTNPEMYKAGNNIASGIRSLGTNKMAPTMGKDIAPTYAPVLKAINIEPDENEVQIQQYLNDPSVIRQWKDGKFKPREMPGDPLWEAYKIFLKQQKGE